MTTLDDLLALLPDNETGDISAEDMRQVVTALWTETQKARSAFSYQWGDTAPVPDDGNVSMDAGWALGSTVLHISKTTKDGEVLPSAQSVGAFGAHFTFLGAGATRLEGIVLGAPADNATYFDVPIEVTLASGSASALDDIRTIWVWPAT